MGGLTDNGGIALCDYPLVSSIGLPTKTIISGGGGQCQLNSPITVICINCTLHQRSLFLLCQQTILAVSKHENGFSYKKIVKRLDVFNYMSRILRILQRISHSRCMGRRLHIYELAFHYA